VHRVVEQVLEAHVVWNRVVVAEDDADIDDAFPQLLKCVW
jgi:hypothetical protein